jgi:hypothetical protein
MELYRKRYFPDSVLLIDGITRAGKSMLSHIVGSLRGVEITRLDMMFEELAYIYGFGKISKDAVVTMLRLEVQTKLYESMIGRFTNFRFHDLTGVFDNVNSLRYFKRLFMKDGDVVIGRIRKENPLFQVQTHDILGFIDIYFEAFGKGLLTLEIIRHPIDLIHSYFVKGYGKRDMDPRNFGLTMKYEGKILPTYAHGWEDLYLSSSQMDRIIGIIDSRTECIKKSYEKLTLQQKKQIMFIYFEKFVTRPWVYLRKIEAFIGRKTTRFTKKALKQQKCPRKLLASDRDKKEKEIMELASENTQKILNKLVRDYEFRFAGGDV